MSLNVELRFKDVVVILFRTIQGIKEARPVRLCSQRY